MSTYTCPGCFRPHVRARSRVLLQTADGARMANVCNACVARGTIVVPALTPCVCGKEAATHGRNCHNAALINAGQAARRS